MQEYQVKRTSPDNLKDLQILYKNAFKLTLSLKDIQKIYDTSFTGRSYIGYIAYANDGTPAAYYGVFPCLINFQNKIILAAQSGGTMTHFDHRGKGLFTLLAKRTYDLAKEEGIKFVFGFPNKNSYPGFINKLNWAHKEDINVYEIYVSTLPFAKAAKKISAFNYFYKKYCNLYFRKLLSKKAILPSSAIDESFGGVYRNADFFEYKKHSDSHLMEIEGKIVWLKVNGYLWVGDIERCHILEFEKIIQKVKNHACNIGADKIIFHTSPGTFLDICLSKNMKPSKTQPIGYLDLSSEIDIAKIKFTGADFDTF